MASKQENVHAEAEEVAVMNAMVATADNLPIDGKWQAEMKPEDKKPEDMKPEDMKPEDMKPEDKKPKEKNLTSYTLAIYQGSDKVEYQMNKKTPNTNHARIFMQYKLTDEIIQSLNIDDFEISNAGFTLDCHSRENLLKLTPNTETGKSQKWKLITVIKSEDCIKGALRGDDGTIALMSSISPECQKTYPHRTCKSFDNDWRICRAKMIAPTLFWNELKKNL
jgi:hypothetical protein